MVSKLFGIVIAICAIVGACACVGHDGFRIYNLLLFISLEAFGFVFLLTFSCLLMTYGLLRPTRMLFDVLHPGAIGAQERIPVNIKICESAIIMVCLGHWK